MINPWILGFGKSKEKNPAEKSYKDLVEGLPQIKDLPSAAAEDLEAAKSYDPAFIYEAVGEEVE